MIIGSNSQTKFSIFNFEILILIGQAHCFSVKRSDFLCDCPELEVELFSKTCYNKTLKISLTKIMG